MSRKVVKINYKKNTYEFISKPSCSKRIKWIRIFKGCWGGESACESAGGARNKPRGTKCIERVKRCLQNKINKLRGKTTFHALNVQNLLRINISSNLTVSVFPLKAAKASSLLKSVLASAGDMDWLLNGSSEAEFLPFM